MEKPLVSVLMPAYNAEKYIAEAIESILNQTYKNFELIIIDDFSTDRTWEIIQKYQKKDKRISAFQNAENLYIAKNRNALLKKAVGKYIAWQDADDISLPNRIQKQVELLEKNPDVGIVGGYLLFYQDDKVISTRKYDTTDDKLRQKIFRYSPVAQPAAMIRKECFERVGEYNPKYPPAEDIDMSFRIGKYYKFANLSEPVIKYRQYDESATFLRLKKIELSTIEVRLKNASNSKYNFGIFDMMYNLMQFISVYIIPPKLKIKLFNAIRNT